jgi:hypothetical protein
VLAGRGELPEALRHGAESGVGVGELWEVPARVVVGPPCGEQTLLAPRFVAGVEGDHRHHFALAQRPPVLRRGATGDGETRAVPAVGHGFATTQHLDVAMAAGLGRTHVEMARQHHGFESPAEPLCQGEIEGAQPHAASAPTRQHRGQKHETQAGVLDLAAETEFVEDDAIEQGRTRERRRLAVKLGDSRCDPIELEFCRDACDRSVGPLRCRCQQCVGTGRRRRPAARGDAHNPEQQMAWPECAAALHPVQPGSALRQK